MVKLNRTDEAPGLHRALTVWEDRSMRITTGHDITDRHHTASIALERCAAYSIANPTIPLRDNPYFAWSTKAARGLGMWECPDCHRMNPAIEAANDDLRTACCRSTTINIHKR